MSPFDGVDTVKGIVISEVITEEGKAMEFIQGMTCPMCHESKCILNKPEFDYKCTVCGHEGYWGQEELHGGKPTKVTEEDDDPIHVSKAEAMVMCDPKYFPQNNEEPVDIDEVRAVVEKLKGTDYFGEVDESFFIDDTSAPERYTDEYRQWWEYHDAKGHDALIGNSPSPYEWLYQDEYKKLYADGKMDRDLYLMLDRMANMQPA